MESRYAIERTQNGFYVRGRDRNPAHVFISDDGISITVKNDAEKWLSTYRYGLYSFYDIHKTVCSTLMYDWKGDEEKYGGKRDKRFYNIRDWAKKRTQISLGRRVHKEWGRLLGMIDQRVLAFQRKIWSVDRGRGYASAPLDKRTYADDHLVNDVIAYRAAAIAVALSDMYHYDLSSDWMLFYSDEETAYRSLRRTLMNIPGGLPYEVYGSMRLVHLERPITKRLELGLLLIYASAHYNRDHVNNHRLHILQHAREDQIRRSLAILSNHLRENLSTRKTVSLTRLVHILMDYPENVNGTIVGWTDAACRYHREVGDRIVDDDLSRLAGLHSADTKTKLPPIDLPRQEEICFLETVGDIYNEGLNMRHCVAGYAGRAVVGLCYLFHIKYNGEEATAEVFPSGFVGQCYGPSNSVNSASIWGRKMLTRWGKQLNTLASPDW